MVLALNDVAEGQRTGAAAFRQSCVAQVAADGDFQHWRRAGRVDGLAERDLDLDGVSQAVRARVSEPHAVFPHEWRRVVGAVAIDAVTPIGRQRH